MADVLGDREQLLQKIKEQGDLVRKLKAAKAEGNQEVQKSTDISTVLASINNELEDSSYVCGWTPTLKDKDLFDVCTTALNGELVHWPHLKRWFVNIQSYTEDERLKFPAPKGPITSLAVKVDRLKVVPSSIDSKELDKKVRQPAACK